MLGPGETRFAGRREDERFVTGQGRYVADLDFPDMLHAAFVRAPYACAHIRAIDIDQAMADPDVVAIFTADMLHEAGVGNIQQVVETRLPDGSPGIATNRPVLSGSAIRHLGEPVAIVIARTKQAASGACEAVDVEYDVLPAVSGIADAMADAAPLVWNGSSGNVGHFWSSGDEAAVEREIAAASHVTRLELTVSRVAGAPLEPRACIGMLGDDGFPTLYATTQSPYQVRAALAQLLRRDVGTIRVIAPDVGGSFGLKGAFYREDAAVLWAAIRLGAPVKWVSDRAEAFLADDQARDALIGVRLALNDDNRFTALSVDYRLNAGAYINNRSLTPIINIGGIAGVYRTPLIAAKLSAILTNTVPTSPYRGAGRPEATYAIERAIDEAARERGLDPMELRRRNLIQPEQMPFKTGLTFTYDCGDFPANMERALTLAERSGFAQRRKGSEAIGRLRGMGMASPIEVSGGPYGRPGKDHALLFADEEDRLHLRCGVMSVGQGLETAMPSIAAGILGIDPNLIRFHQGDTGALDHGRGSGGSSGMAVGGTAVTIAAHQFLERAKGVVANHFRYEPELLTFSEGLFRASGNKSMSLLEAVSRARENGMPLSAKGIYQPTAVTFPNGCHIAEVEIDPETGVVAVIRYVVVEDIGHVLNPVLAEGQLHGGMMQGIGQAVGELVSFDEDGQLISGSFMDYFMPRAGDCPCIVSEFAAVPTAVNPLGVKGAGEAGTVGALSATMNAICDALATRGVRHFDMPATPTRVWTAIDAARKRTDI